ncbi:MAG: molybdopterin-synthase adenylyltransferase MoeB [Candidatus Adiutrix sp.]|jgi:adenylyltransferase/sulfurtransferase|nr:molybdopterin-synthase adenylyltransferase MoeB [Candidatus Adiutrix sp.]
MNTLIDDRRLRPLSEEDRTRYSRHLALPEIGVEGQERLKAAKVLLVGAGGLGSPLGLYLAAAGVGTLGIVDFDVVEESNLQRQVIHGARDVGRTKVASAKDRLQGLNPRLEVITYNAPLTSADALGIIKGYDLVADGTDNFPARYLVNDACVLLGKPNVYGAVFQFEGQASVFYAKEGPCYRCLCPEPPPPDLAPSCAEAGVMGVLPGIVGSIQANEVIKLIVGATAYADNTPDLLIGRLLLFDAWRMTFNIIALDKDPHCPICGETPSIQELMDYEKFCGLKKEAEGEVETITAKELKERMDKGEPLQIIDLREPHERAGAAFPGAKPVPLAQMTRRLAEFDEKTDAVFICRIGRRSVFAIRALLGAGYKGRLLSLKGGFKAWVGDMEQDRG